MLKPLDFDLSGFVITKSTPPCSVSIADLVYLEIALFFIPSGSCTVLSVRSLELVNKFALIELLDLNPLYALVSLKGAIGIKICSIPKSVGISSLLSKLSNHS